MTAAWYLEFGGRIDDGEPIYLRCASCDDAMLPPRQLCPACGSSELVEADLPNGASVVASTKIEATIPKFSGETPYTVVIAEFEDGVRLTGQLRNAEGVERGDPVELGVEQRGDDELLVTFAPIET